MGMKNFILSLRKIIREEVRAAVRQEVKQLLQEQRTSNVPRPAKQVVSQKRTPQVMFDGPLASILNETAQAMSNNHVEQDDWQDMNGGALTADQAEGFGLASLMNRQEVAEPAVGSRFSGDPTMAFVKDYTAVMNAADKFANKQ